jgi:hypothetical protein
VYLGAAHSYADRTTGVARSGNGQAIDIAPPVGFTERAQLTNGSSRKLGGMIETSDDGPFRGSLTATTNEPTNVISIAIALR